MLIFLSANGKSQITTLESINLFLTLTYFFGQWMAIESVLYIAVQKNDFSGGFSPREKCEKYGVFSVPYFPVFGLKIRTRKTPYFHTFHAVVSILVNMWPTAKHYQIQCPNQNFTP